MQASLLLPSELHRLRLQWMYGISDSDQQCEPPGASLELWPKQPDSKVPLFDTQAALELLSQCLVRPKAELRCH